MADIDPNATGLDSDAPAGTPSQGQPEPQAAGTTTAAKPIDTAGLQSRAVRAEQRLAETLRTLGLPKDSSQKDIDSAITRMRAVGDDAEAAQLDPEIQRRLQSLENRAWEYEEGHFGEVAVVAKELWTQITSGARLDPSDFMATFFRALEAAAKQAQPVAGEAPAQTAGQQPAQPNLAVGAEPPIQRSQPAVGGLANSGKLAEGFKALRAAVGR